MNNNRTFFYSALFLFSSMAVACQQVGEWSFEDVHRTVLACAILNSYDVSSARWLIESDVIKHKEYRIVNRYEKSIEQLPTYDIENHQLLLDNNIEEKDKYVEIINSKSKSAVLFGNQSSLVRKLNYFYDCYKERNNGWLYNSYAPFYIHLVDNLEDNSANSCLLKVKNAISVELQPQQVEEIVGSKYLRNWKIAKGIFLMSILALIAKNYSQLMQIINRG